MENLAHDFDLGLQFDLSPGHDCTPQSGSIPIMCAPAKLSRNGLHIIPAQNAHCGVVQMNRDLGQPLAVGGTAEVYAWEPGWVLKLYFDRYESGMANFERRIAAAVRATGLPVPAVC